MAEVTVTQTINAPLSVVWETWDNFGGIAAFNPVVRNSFLLDDSIASGLGATRQCDMADGKNYIREKVVGYTPQKQMQIDIYEGSIPVDNASATLDFKELGPVKTEVSMTMKFTPKMGIVGKMMLPIMKRQFSGMLAQLLSGNAEFAENRVIATAM